MIKGFDGQRLDDVLEDSEAASPVDAVDAVTNRLAADLGATRVAFLIADLSGRALVRLTQESEKGSATRLQHGESAETLSFDDVDIEDALREQHARSVALEDGWRVLAPVTQRGEVIGLLEILMTNEPDASTLELISRTAHTLAFVVIANRRHTDLFEWGQRSAPFELSAEIQRRLLPSAFTCEAGAFTLSAWLEPAATIGGDTFDYTTERDVLHLSVTDAMGHGVLSALTATVCIGSLRNTRRVAASLLEQAMAADAAVRKYASDSFVAGILGRLDLKTGVLSLVNAGHVLPLLVRDGEVSEIALPADLPFGLDEGRGYRSTDVQLVAGDRIVIVTDGMLERRAAVIDLEEMLRVTSRQHPRETTRHLADAVLDVAGPTLADDATTFVLDWHGGHGQPRLSHAGATTHPSASD